MIYNLSEHPGVTPAEPLGAFRACVMADEAIATTLCAIEDSERYVEAALRVTAARGIPLTAAAIRHAIAPDPLNIARFLPKPPDGAVWPPRHWLPIDVSIEGDRAMIDWTYFGAEPLTDPFFEGAIRRAVARPFNRMFRYRMTLDDFIADAPRHESLPPAGLIFHMSRCGSTLVAQMLASLPRNIVISEAAPVDTMVQLCRTAPHLPAQSHIALLRAVVAAYGRQRSDDEQHLFLKLDCWHALALPLFRQVFPDTPWIFLYRDPVEVLVSHVRQRGAQMVPAITPPQLYGIDDFDGVPNEDYCARVLGIICDAAATHLGDGAGLAVNYRELPRALHKRILPHFGVDYSAADYDTMTKAARQDAKAPHFEFAEDRAGKQRDARPSLRAAADAHLAAVYRRLEALNSD